MVKHSITLIGRRWRGGSNTYHTVAIVLDGRPTHFTGTQYGYGDHYVETATAALVESCGFPAFGGRSLRRWCDDNGIEFYATVSDVARRVDL